PRGVGLTGLRAEAATELADGAGLIASGRENRDGRQIQVGQDLAPRDSLVRVPPEAVNLDLLVAPDPDLADAERAVDLELVEAPAGPHDLDGEVGEGLGAVDLVVLVGLDPPLLG